MSVVYCRIHREKLIHLKYVDNKGDVIETGYCFKCNREYCEYSDVSPIYISNYEFGYILNEKENKRWNSKLVHSVLNGDFEFLYNILVKMKLNQLISEEDIERIEEIEAIFEK